jgi:hypothetical protein
MKNRFRILAALFVFAAAACSSAQTAGTQDKGQNNSGPTVSVEGSDKAAEAGKGLRNRLFTLSPEELGLSGEDAKAKVWGVLMDVSVPSGTATLVSVRDGTASLYTSTGRGIILGGYTARDEAKAFVSAAETSLKHVRPTKTFEYPAVGLEKFYVLTREGVLAAEAKPEDLLKKEHELSPLFRAANEVLTRLRLASQEREQ